MGNQVDMQTYCNKWKGCDALLLLLLAISVSFSSTIIQVAEARQSQEVSIRMPDIRPDHKEQYLCVAHRLSVNRQSQYIVEFNPKSNASRVHHLLVFGCSVPGIIKRDTPYFTWDCGQMHSSVDDNQLKSYERGLVCQDEPHIIYGWALDAPALKLPDGVGFKVGGYDTNIHYLVLQVHYGHIDAFEKLPDLTDNSGLVMKLVPDDMDSGITKQAGVLLLASYGYVLPGKSRHEIWCDINENIEMHPFRFRTHTHKLGTKVLGAKLTHKSLNHLGLTASGKAKDEIIGVKDPQEPQMFYPVLNSNMTITRGDSVYAYCEFNNNKSNIVDIGNTGDDEMCNFYMMYWTHGSRLLPRDSCISVNPRRPLPPYFQRRSVYL